MSAIYSRIAVSVAEAVGRLRQLEIEGIRRAIPVEFDTERGGVIPGAS